MNIRVAAALVAVALAASACGAGDDAGAPPLLVTTTTSAAGSTATESPATDSPATESPANESPATDSPANESPPGSTGQAEIENAEIEQVDCPEQLVRGDGLELACGVATVPIDRDGDVAGSTRITVAALPGYDAGFATPVAVLQGGPGGSSTELGTWFPQQAFTQVFVDQRGTGFVGPDFDCPELIDSLGRVLSSDSVEGGLVAEAAYDDCARRLDDDIVLRNTDTAAHAADVAAVMAGLGYGRWVVYGVSYGSTIGLEVLRDAPEGLAGAVLDGVYPTTLDTDLALVGSAERVLDEIDVACRSESICRAYLADGSFRSTLERVMEELDASPLVVDATANEIGYSADVSVVLDGRRVAEFVFLLTYNESLMRYLPAVVGGLDDRDASSARWLATTGARLLISSQSANDEGTYFAVQCHDRLPFTDGPGDDLPPFGAAVAAVGLAPICEEWERPLADASVDDPVASAIPTLLLSGTFDPITPAAYADEVAELLSASTNVEQGGRGHGIWYGSDCIAQIVQRFVADPARTLDTACAAEPVPVEWARP